MAQPELFITSTIDAVAKRLFISTATISRCCKQLEFAGYQQFKFAVAQALEHETELVVDVKTESLTSQAERIEREINATITNLSANKVAAAVSHIMASRSIEFFGVGASLPLCLEASRKLTFAGKLSSARSDWDELEIVSQRLTSADLAIIISYSGETEHVVRYATALNERHVPIISLIGNANSSLEKRSVVTLRAHVTNAYYGELDMTSRIPFHVILELVLLEYLKATGVER
ncbi:helix-turn-helix domain, rpiR family protein [Brochothrix campestris FSL F6-1037]|uniref:Helix-turn-helix domain, rpiR family protein n=2 Tax=Brochothrix campestris TaxID=2757 RepID=W7CIH8_9LIST|nr:helix-turn-helix domain, rpiR family protein [Brochothrix campestris FSL F6-1037]